MNGLYGKHLKGEKSKYVENWDLLFIWWFCSYESILNDFANGGLYRLRFISAIAQISKIISSHRCNYVDANGDRRCSRNDADCIAHGWMSKKLFWDGLKIVEIFRYWHGMRDTNHTI